MATGGPGGTAPDRRDWTIVISLLAAGSGVPTLNGGPTLISIEVDPMVLAAFALLSFVVIFLKPMVGVLALVFIEFSILPSTLIGPSLTLKILLMAETSLGLALEISRSRISARNLLWFFRDPLFLWLAAFYGWVVLRTYLALGHFAPLYELVNNLVIVLLVSVVVREKRALGLVLLAAFAGCAQVTLAGFAYWVHTRALVLPPPLLNGYYGIEISMALQSLIGACLGLGLLASGAYPRLRVPLAGATAMCSAMALSGCSRGVTVAGFALILAFMFSRRRYPLPIYVFGGLAFAALTLLVNYDGWVALWDRAFSTTTHVYQAAELSSGRIYLYQAALAIFPTSPLFGIGWEHFKDIWFIVKPAPVFAPMGLPRLDVHCSYLQILVETGILGFFLYAMWTVAVFRRARTTLGTLREQSGTGYHTARAMTIACGYALAGLLLHSAFDNNGRGNYRSHLLLVMLIGALSRLVPARQPVAREAAAPAAATAVQPVS